jgi:predicted O-methyltransferase YrrM
MRKYTMDKLKWSIAQLVKDIDPQVGILDKEGCLLFDYASKIPTKGLIIEIGSWRGRSTVWLGQGAMLRGGQVLAVDPHMGMEGYGESYTEFIDNIKRCKIVEVVMPILLTSKAFFETYKEKVDMIFLDGLHDFENINFDTLESLKHLKEGGVLALHDTIAYTGPCKVVKNLLAVNPQIRLIKQVGQINLSRKVKYNILNLIWNQIFLIYFRLYSLIFLTALLLPKSLKEKIKSI